MTTKALLDIHQAPPPHWVGDGFPVSSVFSMQGGMARRMSPFLLLDYAAPTEFGPSDKPRGVDSHPHKGFETVTIVYQGALEHRDSTGSHGTIGPGDVQWMTAGAGILHEEKHERTWSKRGGMFQVAQLWVNLPAASKTAPAGYQTLGREEIPVVEIAGGGGSLRVIAGEYGDTQGPAKTFTPIDVYDLRLNAGREITLKFPAGHHTAVVVQEGEVRLNDDRSVGQVSLALFDMQGEEIHIRAVRDAMLLVLSGEPIDEPIAAYGPFVMNTQEEIRQAVEDFRGGRMGRLDGV